MSEVKKSARRYSNAAAGYDLVADKVYWWQHPAFPLVPMFEARAGDEWNCPAFSFSWLCLRVWSLEHFCLELSLELDNTGLNIKGIIPYIRIVVRVLPLPYFLLNKLRRKPQGELHG